QLAGGTSQNLMGYLFGSLSTVTAPDVVIAVVLAVVVLGIGLGLSGLLAAVTSDEEFARASGLPVRAVNILIAVMAALTVTLSMRIVGALMVSALMIVPVAAAQTLVVGFTRTMRTAMAIAVFCSLGGLVITVYVDLPPGGVIVLLSIGVYALGLITKAGRPGRRGERQSAPEAGPGTGTRPLPSAAGCPSRSARRLPMEVTAAMGDNLHHATEYPPAHRDPRDPCAAGRLPQCTADPRADEERRGDGRTGHRLPHPAGPDPHRPPGRPGGRRRGVPVPAVRGQRPSPPPGLP